MAINVSNAAERRQLTALVNAQTFKTLKLFQNDYIPDANTDTANFTEANFGGYAAQNPTWGAVATDVEGNATTTSNTLNFASSSAGPQTIYGYYVVDNAGAYTFGERFPAPIAISNVTAPIAVTVLYKLRQIP